MALKTYKSLICHAEADLADFLLFVVLDLLEADFLVAVFFDLADLVDLTEEDFVTAIFFSVRGELSTTSNRLTWLFKRAALFL